MKYDDDEKELKDELRQRWGLLGYSTRMGSAAVVPPPPKDFKRLYKVLPACYAISNIENKRIKVTEENGINDPFEFAIFSYQPPNIRALGAGKEKTDMIKELKEFLKCKKRNFFRKEALICLSEDWTSAPLWTHYGGGHTGICLGFDVRVSESLRQVAYETERLDLNLETIRKFNEKFFLEKFVYSKSTEWQYEREWRMSVNRTRTIEEDEHSFMSFNEDFRLREVILGLNYFTGNDSGTAVCKDSGPLCLEAIRETVTATVKDAVVYQARIADKFFNLVPDEKTLNWDVGDVEWYPKE